MGHPPLPPPPQMSNGGSPPAHLPSFYFSDPSWWLQFKWSQPPPRAPEWLFTYYERYNPPANVGRPLRDKESIFLWLRRRLLLVRINHRTLRRQQRDAALARLRYEQDCCRHATVAQERRHHEEAAKHAAASAQLVCQRARPRCRTGRRNCPRAPSPPDEAPPSHPHQMLGGLHMPASTTLVQATSLCRSVVSSTTPSLMAPPTSSLLLLPFTFLGDVVRSSSGGGDTYPFQASSPPRKRTRRKPPPRRVCRRHGPCAPNQVEHLLCWQRHRRRAPNQSTHDGWD